MAKPPVNGETDDGNGDPTGWRSFGVRREPPGGSATARRTEAPVAWRAPAAGILLTVRLALFSLLLAAAIFLFSAGSAPAAPPGAASATSFARFGGGHSFGGGGGLGRSHGFFGGSRPRSGFGSRSRRSHGFLRGIARALAFAYIFHLLFSGGHGIILLLLIVGAFALLARRRRRRARFG